MGDVLAGFHAVWEFESDSVLIRYERGIRTPKLFQALGERRIPLSAVEEVTLTQGKRGTVALRLRPRPGADPVMEAAAGQLREGSDPYRLALPAERSTLAEYYADELKGLLTESGPTDRYLVAAPEAPLQFKAYDGKASFDGTTVQFRWSWTGASSTKWKAGDQSFAVAGLSGVEWRSPEVFEGHLRLLPREGGSARPTQPDQDPASVVFGLGYGPVHESLPFAAAVLAGVRSRGPVPAVPAPARRDPADIAERIRHLGELHQAGLVTDEEFASKKAELLAEL
ncbi:DUF4429 domain-containing protein [Streptomyces diastatochromogenes]|uniref:DUF4429 domain-containing protein n=1 Tax=Streptomyces diastatochromogenes TaxID=42236 RepID=A0A233SES1_STRDA|nr:DUF4429 domain-containing protein [Streptomyces diastatochromogenes]MCZ0989438.1 DUF4429 domain-containing protein [Streptomyces diastatochromogenes]OXY94140.1 hypothetical protein BEK98_19890 [Streptomyces diastatochromogenes]